ncbi:diacylglycerol/lipid kinase family protein [Marihabitans asiaticum]|nr:diacylglycerol kinase family protein [Marihabitans asiaticum]
MTRVALVLNPVKRRADQLVPLLAAACAERGWPEPTVLETTVAETGAAQAAAAAKGGARLVLAAGGDGTVRSVAQGVHPFAQPDGVVMGVVPLGTANLFAHNLGLPIRDLRAALALALDGTARPVDLGLATFDEERVEHPFLVLAGFGHDAATVAATRDELKHRIGWPAYILPAARHAIRRPVPMSVSLDGEVARPLRAWSVLAANASRVRAGVRITAGAELDDGLLEVLEVTVRRPDQWLPIAAKGVLGLRRDVPGLVTRSAREVEIVASDPQHVQLDGDITADVSRVRVRLMHQAVMVNGTRERAR